MFRCVVLKTIWHDRGHAVLTTLCYRTVAQIPPYVGMEISEQNWNSGPFKRVTYDSKEQLFICEVGEEEPPPDSTEDGAALLERAYAEGWREWGEDMLDGWN